MILGMFFANRYFADSDCVRPDDSLDYCCDAAAIGNVVGRLLVTAARHDDTPIVARCRRDQFYSFTLLGAA
jgi:hypothetical protein